MRLVQAILRRPTALVLLLATAALVAMVLADRRRRRLWRWEGMTTESPTETAEPSAGQAERKGMAYYEEGMTPEELQAAIAAAGAGMAQAASGRLPAPGKVVANLPMTRSSIGSKDAWAKWGKKRPYTFQPLKSTFVTSGIPEGQLGSRAPRRAVKIVYMPGTGAGREHSFSLHTGKINKTSGGLMASFKVYYPADFQFSCGGKIAGFKVGPGDAEGCGKSRDGGSHRIMWQDSGHATSYIYTPTIYDKMQRVKELQDGSKKKCGISLLVPNGPVLRRGQWNTITIGLKLNTLRGEGQPNADGQLLLVVNGNSVYRSGIVWRGRKSHGFEDFLVHTFYGGPCTSPAKGHAFVSDVTLYNWD
jgi:hypothetical protein